MRVAIRPLLLACCAAEVATALAQPPALASVQWVEDEPEVTVVVIAGTITLAHVPLVQATVDAVTGPRAVVAYGVCASSGGPYWDSDTVLQGWQAADLFVPGCPPPARVLWSSVVRAAEEAMARVRA